MTASSYIHMMVHYMAWANGVTLDNVAQLNEVDIHAPRDSLFKSIAGTFDHILVVEEIFQAHLEGRPHSFTARVRDIELPFTEINKRLREIDQYYLSLCESLSEDQLNEVIIFEFVGGGTGAMRRADILLHLANHSTYHRGFIATLAYPLKMPSRASGLTVFLRDVWKD